MSMSCVFKKIMPKSIFARFVMILVIPVILSQLIIIGVFTEKYSKIAIGIISKQMAGQALAITKLLDMGCDKVYLNTLKKNMNIQIDTLKDSELSKTGISKDHKTYRAMRRAIINRGISEYYIDTHNDSLDVYIPSNKNKDIYKVSFSRKNLYMKIIPIVLGWGISSTFMLLIIAFIFLKNQVRPIKKLAIAVNEFGRYQMYEGYKPEGAKEIRLLGVSFCNMAQSIKSLVDTRMKILAGISHDLKTPLTKMKLQLSIMERSEETNLLKKDVETMISIAKNFTLYASEQYKESPQKVNLKQLIGDVKSRYVSNNFNVYVSCNTKIFIFLKLATITRSFNNIIENAQKYAHCLHINVLETNENIIINFEDDGPGINEDDMPKIFEAFYKANKARTSEENSGVGLGLSIAYDGVIANSGTITVEKSSYGGAKFVITFPNVFVN